MLSISPNENVLPPHLHASAGMNLQANHAIGEFRRRVRKVHDLHAVELRHDVSALHGRFEVIPLAGLQRPLTFQPVRLSPLKRETHPVCGGAFATTADTTNIAAARNAPILLTGKPPSLSLRNQRVWPE